MKEEITNIRRYFHAHEAVIINEYWYGDGTPLLRSTFSAAKTVERQIEIVDLLLKAAKRSAANDNWELTRPLEKLARKIDRCRKHDRCGSLACPKCARAFQRAKTAAQQQLIKRYTEKFSFAQPKKLDGGNSSLRDPILVMATVIPLHLQYAPADLPRLDIAKHNRWLKDVLTKADLAQMMVGSADLSWEHRRNQHYYQLHWHLAMWTDNPEKLQRQLLRCFPPENKYDRPAQIEKSYSSNFVPYMHKAIKLPDLLLRNRRELPRLLVALDRIAPLDLMVISGVRLSAQSGRLALRPFGH